MDYYATEIVGVKNFGQLNEGQSLLLYEIVGSNIQNLSSQIYSDSIAQMQPNLQFTVSSAYGLNAFLKTVLKNESIRLSTPSFGIMLKCNTVDVLGVRRMVERRKYWFNPVTNGRVSYDLHIQQNNGPDKTIPKEAPISKSDINELTRRGARLYFTLRPLATSSSTQPVMRSIGWCDGHLFQEEVLRIQFGHPPME